MVRPVKEICFRSSIETFTDWHEKVARDHGGRHEG
jgi:hypothetical protein